MAEVGIRELKNHVAEIVRAVREERVEYTITHRGKPVARLVPLSDESGGEDAWAELDRLSQEVSDRWCSDRSALELLTEARR
jgi:prevent-host-death family protein